jgi:hypothetical protein
MLWVLHQLKTVCFHLFLGMNFPHLIIIPTFLISILPQAFDTESSYFGGNITQWLSSICFSIELTVISENYGSGQFV